MRSTFLALYCCALASACYAPSYQDCAVTCATSQTCPSGLTCVTGRCVSDESVSCTGGDGGGPVLPTGPWGAPQAVLFAGMTSTLDDDPTLTEDMLEIYVHRVDNPNMISDIYFASRPTATAPWSALSRVAEVSLTTPEDSPEVSSDGLTMYITRSVSGDFNIHECKRGSRSAAWGPPARVDPVNSNANDWSPAMSHDGLSMVLSSNRNSTIDIFMTTRAALTSGWSMPVVLSVSTNNHEDSPFLLSDNKTLYYAASNPTTMGYDLFKATKGANNIWTSTPIAELNTAEDETDPWVSPDGHTLYFTRNQRIMFAIR